MVTFLGLQGCQTWQHVAFLWGQLKSKVYAHCPHNIEEPKERIHEEIS
jgi:predicted metal-dependent enzyme (double-stranded beta helix superfamily)